MTMTNLLGRLMLLFPLWPMIAIAAAAIFYARHRRRTEVERRIPVVLYAIAVLGSGAIAVFGGMLIGMTWACSSPDAGNLCGLVGVFVTGPIAGMVATILVAFALSKV